jgi:beta-lactamase class D
MAIVRDLLEIERGDGYTIRGKTGFGPISDDRSLRWLVGYVERGDDVDFFAFHITVRPEGDLSRQEAIDLVVRILRDLRALPRPRGGA